MLGVYMILATVDDDAMYYRAAASPSALQNVELLFPRGSAGIAA